MAPIGFKLFGVNDKNELVWREPNVEGDPWKVIQSLDETENGKTLQVKHVASVEGVLFLINDGTYPAAGGNPGKLLARFATLTPLAAGAVGHASGVSSLASYKGALYSISSYLGKRVPDFANSPWVGASDLPFLAGTHCMTATREYLIAAVQTGLRKWKPGMASWELLDSNSGRTANSGLFVAIAAVGDDVYAIINNLGKTHELWVRRNGKWDSLGKIDPVRTMTAALAVDLSKTSSNVAELQAVAV